MYSAILLLHSWLRWLVLLAAAIVIVRAIAGMAGAKPWSRGIESSLKMFSISLDIQFLLGLILYVGLSPFTRAAFQSMAAAMRDPAARFFAVEHLIGMIIAVIFAHVGRGQIRKTTLDAGKYQRALIFTSIALLVILASIPWPGLAAGRPLFRF